MTPEIPSMRRILQRAKPKVLPAPASLAATAELPKAVRHFATVGMAPPAPSQLRLKHGERNLLSQTLERARGKRASRFEASISAVAMKEGCIAGQSPLSRNSQQLAELFDENSIQLSDLTRFLIACVVPRARKAR